MDNQSRGLARAIVTSMLILCGLVDGMLGELAISGPDTCIIPVVNGRWVPPTGDPTAWPWIALFVVFQGVLVCLRIRFGETSSMISLR